MLNRTGCKSSGFSFLWPCAMHSARPHGHLAQVCDLLVITLQCTHTGLTLTLSTLYLLYVQYSRHMCVKSSGVGRWQFKIRMRKVMSCFYTEAELQQREINDKINRILRKQKHEERSAIKLLLLGTGTKRQRVLETHLMTLLLCKARLESRHSSSKWESFMARDFLKQIASSFEEPSFRMSWLLCRPCVMWVTEDFVSVINKSFLLSYIGHGNAQLGVWKSRR